MKIEATEETPEFLINESESKISLKGRAFPENAISFFDPIFKSTYSFIEKSNSVVRFEIDLEYFNSASTKQLINLISSLETFHQNGKNILIVWKYDKGDDLIKAKGQEFSTFFDLPFKVEAI
jgi:hypothetical protein